MRNGKSFFVPLPCCHLLLPPAPGFVVSFALPNASFQGSFVSLETAMKVELKPDGSALKCVECRRVYPIRDDIPVMLIDEATIEDGTESETEKR